MALCQIRLIRSLEISEAAASLIIFYLPSFSQRNIKVLCYDTYGHTIHDDNSILKISKIPVTKRIAF